MFLFRQKKQYHVFPPPLIIKWLTPLLKCVNTSLYARIIWKANITTLVELLFHVSLLAKETISCLPSSFDYKMAHSRFEMGKHFIVGRNDIKSKYYFIVYRNNIKSKYYYVSRIIDSCFLFGKGNNILSSFPLWL